ncbi:MAG: MFS transporter [Planctomycetota bacterium]|nr:MFS transporter [Planctomycetota bacterium]
MQFEQSKTLASRTYIGLVLSQFLAAFNDQAIHIVAIFYASDMLIRFAQVSFFDQKLVLAVVTGCFISPFFLFSPWAGVLADKFSKRSTIIFWKVTEVGITALALIAFLLPHAVEVGAESARMLAIISAFLLIACVFMMGTHSAFFVPAKYGVMPEILHTSVLSRGNGILEGTSFVSNILGTSFGGILYSSLKSTVDVNGVLHPNREWVIGAVLLGLAVIGVVFSFLVRKMPAAAPEKKLTWNPLVPLKGSFQELGRSRSLVLATIGIAFFTFMTLYMRQSLLFEGETDKDLAEMQRKLVAMQKAEKNATRSAFKPVVQANGATSTGRVAGPASGSPVATLPEGELTTVEDAAMDKSQEHELRIAMLVAFIGLGVGIGCAVAGQLSGNRLELGLVPIGGIGMAVLTLALAAATPLHLPGVTIACLILIGFAAGLYIVPMYTLLQHRAPKESKGSMVAVSNFLNVTGGLVAIVVFYCLTLGLQAVLGLSMTNKDAVDIESTQRYIAQLEFAQRIPPLLFGSASVITVITLLSLIWQRPDFLVRTLSWIRIPSRRYVRAVHADHLPGRGPLIVVTNCSDIRQWMHVIAVVDRYTRFVMPQTISPEDQRLASFSRLLGITLPDASPSDPSQWNAMLESGARSLREGNMVGLYVGESTVSASAMELIRGLQSRTSADILPVYYGEYPPHSSEEKRISGRTSVVIGERLPADATAETIGDGLFKFAVPPEATQDALPAEQGV